MATKPEKGNKLWLQNLIDTNTGINEGNVSFILWNEQFYSLEGRLPTFEESADLQYSHEQWKQMWLSKSIREALVARGVPLAIPVGNEIDYPLPSVVLTGPQLEAINVVLDLNDTRPHHKKLKDLGISTREWQTWQRDPAFYEYYRQRSESLLKKGSADADQALLDNVRMGDMSAIKYFNEYTGRYRPQDPAVIDFKIMIAQLLDVLAKHLTPEQHNTVALEIQEVLQHNGVASAGDPVPIADGVVIGELIEKARG